MPATAASRPATAVPAPATTAGPTTTPAPATTAPATTTATGPEDAPGGAGDEEPIRVPAAFTVSGTSVSPGRISVPAFLPVGLSFGSGDGAAHEVLVRTPEPTRLSVAAGQTAQTTLPGQPAGLFLIEVDGTPTGAALAVGGDPGP